MRLVGRRRLDAPKHGRKRRDQTDKRGPLPPTTHKRGQRERETLRSTLPTSGSSTGSGNDDRQRQSTETDGERGESSGLASLPIELVGAIVNGRDRHGRAFMDPRWRCMARMACRLLRRAVEQPAPWDDDTLGDAQVVFRYPMVGAGDRYVDLDMTHARRRRWRRGATVCASVVAEWLRTIPAPLTRDDMDALAERMVSHWGASRAAAHLVLLAADRPETVAYALDPAISAPFAPMPAVPDYPSAQIVPYDPTWRPDGQVLLYAMTDVAVRRCACATVLAVLAAVDAAPWLHYVYPKDDDDDDDDDDSDSDDEYNNGPASNMRRGLCRTLFSASVLGFDRHDVAVALGREHTFYDTDEMLFYGAARFMHSHVRSGRHGTLPTRPLLPKTANWVWGNYVTCDMGTTPSAVYALAEVPAEAIDPAHAAAILLAAIRADCVDVAVWALRALGHARVTADALLCATGLTATGLVEHAVCPRSRGTALRRSRAGIGRHAGTTRSAAWLCDVLAYAPTRDDLCKLAAACVMHTNSAPSCCVARAIFLLERWPLELWETQSGVPLVRDAFVSCVAGQPFGRDAIDLIDAIEAWSDAVGVDHETMRDELGLFCSMACRGASSACVKSTTSALYGHAWTQPCSSVCYGTCRAALDPTAPFCNGRTRSDADRIVAWCLPNFSAHRWPV